MDTVLLYTICICVVAAAICGIIVMLQRRRYYISEYYEKTSLPFLKMAVNKEFRFAYRLSGLLEALPFAHETLYHCLVPLADKKMVTIDCLVFCGKGIYVIANETCCGNICGDEKHSQWRAQGRRKKYYFDNPVKKNYCRIGALCTFLEIPDRCCKSIIAFHGAAVLKRIRIKSARTFVTRAKDLDIYFDSEKNKPDVLPVNDLYRYYGNLRRVRAEQFANQIGSPS